MFAKRQSILSLWDSVTLDLRSVAACGGKEGGMK